MFSALLRIPFLAAALGGAAVSLPVAAEPLQATATYSVTVGSSQLASVRAIYRDTGSVYSLDANAKITGLAQLIASGTAKLQSTGASTSSGLRSQRFDLTTRAQGDEFAVAITYAGGDVSSFKVNPPIVNNINRVAIERKQLVGNVNDMAAALIIRGDKLDASLCDRNLQVFTGVERFNLKLSYARDDEATSKRTGYQGPTVVCNVRYSPISGHYTSSKVTRDLATKERILIWYAPLATEGYFIPYRALVTTESGDIAIVLTELVQ